LTLVFGGELLLVLIRLHAIFISQLLFSWLFSWYLIYCSPDCEYLLYTVCIIFIINRAHIVYIFVLAWVWLFPKCHHCLLLAPKHPSPQPKSFMSSFRHPRILLALLSYLPVSTTISFSSITSSLHRDTGYLGKI